MAKRRSNKISKIGDVDVARAVIAHEAVRCYLAVQDARKRQPKSLTSCFGGIFWGKPGETWPTTEEGRALIPWLQLKCADVERAYGPFYQPQAITFFLDPEFEGPEALSQEDHAEFVVRTYEPAAHLEPLERPEELGNHKYVAIKWIEKDDYPSISKYYRLFESDAYDALCDTDQLKFQNNYGTKIGGWPTPLQRGQDYPGAWDMQIDMTPNFMYSDSGIGYLSKSGENWYLCFETC